LLVHPYPSQHLRAIMLTVRSTLELDSVPLQVGRLKIDPLAHEVRLDQAKVHLTVRELESSCV
jgi:DNA-binding response OmpR family regulator